MVKPPLRTKSIGFKVSEEEYARLEEAAQASGRTLGEWRVAHPSCFEGWDSQVQIAAGGPLEPGLA